MTYWFCGGEYLTGNRVCCKEERAFRAVRPTKGKPYIARSAAAAANLFHLSKHHSHLYMLSEDMQMATLVQRGESSQELLPAPQKVTINFELRTEFQAQISENDFIGEW